MIKVHCNQLSDFLKIYVFDWHVLSALLIPLLFASFFPVYWFFICPAIWRTDLTLYRPRSWLLGYWLLASMVWFVFLVICFFHMRNGRKLALAMNNTNCMAQKSYSTEDLWNEDAYIPESYLPTPEYKVNISQVQPQTIDTEQSGLRRPSTKSMPMYHAEKGSEEEQQPLLLPPPQEFQNENQFEKEPSFDMILASLQNLAHEIERDFDRLEEGQDCQSLHCYLPSSLPQIIVSEDLNKTKSTGDLSSCSGRK